MTRNSSIGRPRRLDPDILKGGKHYILQDQVPLTMIHIQKTEEAKGL
jgi:hypothetical protein